MTKLLVTTPLPRTRGFTIVELLVVVTILGVLASIGLPLAQLAYKRQHEEELRSALREIRGALDAYKLATDTGHIPRNASDSGYPPSLKVLVDGVEDAQSPNRARMYFLRSLPTDPFLSTEGETPDSGWALRSYESPPNDPKPGNDVYDVHSTSNELGLNGVPYKLW